MLQGPPGTGKSQTIANIIAECLASDKSVLFVSEKMAALEVVKQRLDTLGLGQFCLEAHSHRANKYSIINELASTLNAPPRSGDDIDTNELNRIERLRDQLNAYMRALHERWGAVEQTPYYIHGKLTALHDAPQLSFQLPNPLETKQETLEKILAAISRIESLDHIYASPDEHPWAGFSIDSYSFQLKSQIEEQFTRMAELLEEVSTASQELSEWLGMKPPLNLEQAYWMNSLFKVHIPNILNLEISELMRRFDKSYQGVFKYLMPKYYRDMRAIRQTAMQPDSLNDRSARDHLQLAYRVKPKLGAPTRQNVSRSAEYQALRDHLREALLEIGDVLRFINGIYPLEEKPINGEYLYRLPFEDARDWFSQKTSQTDELKDWIDYQNAVSQLQELGLKDFLRRAQDREIAAAQLRPTFEKHFYQAWLDQVYQQSETLQQFNSREFEQTLQQFRELDKRQLSLAQKRIQHHLSQKRPSSHFADAPSSEQSILLHEANKKRRHKPIRRLFKEIPGLLPTLKPCLMMSPLSVSHFLDPETTTFDLVVFDEASQVLPEDAVGAILRGQQAVIVGDSKQLPPTQFFSAMESDEFLDEAAAEQGAYDSILDKGSAIGLPNVMLRWHYRSEDESLIAFSNHHFYENRLNTFPRASHDGATIGVSFVNVPDGIYDRGKSKQNKREAEKVVDLVFEHIHATPKLSLGVVAFSQAQQSAILDVLEQRRKEQPELEPWFDEDQNEPFFVKNLENVQGDERDVMFFSVGYGKDASGKMSLNFGPLNSEGGHRRLNVAVTRAKQHVKLIASIEPSDINIEQTQSRAIHLLRNYMEYAQRNGDVSVLHGRPELNAQADFDSPFEHEVYEALQDRGYTVHNQVGCSGYRIDMAVVDAEKPGRYVLGIECDGATYHSSNTARERDRLRQELLEGKYGWRIHRIWSRDWADNPERELEKLERVIKQAQNENLEPSQSSGSRDQNQGHRNAASATNMVSVQAGSAETDDSTTTGSSATHQNTASHQPNRTDELPLGVQEYHEISMTDVADLVRVSQHNPKRALQNAVDRIVKREGPIHAMEAARRVADFYGAARAGARIQRDTQSAATALSSVRIRGDFYWPKDMETPPVRVPVPGDDPRDIESICVEEIAEAAFLCIENAFSMTRDDLVTQTARLLGYSRTGEKVKKRIEKAIKELISTDRLEQDGDSMKRKA